MPGVRRQRRQSTECLEISALRAKVHMLLLSTRKWTRRWPLAAIIPKRMLQRRLLITMVLAVAIISATPMKHWYRRSRARARSGCCRQGLRPRLHLSVLVLFRHSQRRLLLYRVAPLDLDLVHIVSREEEGDEEGYILPISHIAPPQMTKSPCPQHF